MGTIRGTDWVDTVTQNVEMNVGDTRHGGSQGVAYLSKNPLTDSNQQWGVCTPGEQNFEVFQLKPNLINPAYSGDAIQTVTFTMTC